MILPIIPADRIFTVTNFGAAGRRYVCKKGLSILLMHAMVLSCGGGCQWGKTSHDANLCSLGKDFDPVSSGPVATEIEYTRVRDCNDETLAEMPRPYTVEDGPPTEFWDLGLEEAIAIALRENDVLKDLGGARADGSGSRADYLRSGHP